MAIKKISVSNFRSFNKLEVDLNDFNVLIGSNAAGKSNFVQIFKFLRDMVTYDLENALSIQGGVEFFRNMGIGASRDFELEVITTQGLNRVFPTSVGLQSMEVTQTTHKITLEFMKKAKKLRSVREKVAIDCEFSELERRGKEERLVKTSSLGKGNVVISNDNGTVTVDLEVPEKVEVDKDDLIPSFLLEEKLPRGKVLPSMFFWFLPPPHEVFSGVAIYDFDPKLPKRAAPITGKADLEEDGSNLALVLKDIVEDKEKKRKFSNLIRELLPFVEDLGTERFADKSLLFKLKESYNLKNYTPASLISDGTVNITALVIALYFEDKPITLVEEPEKGIHPHLIAKVVNMMKDASAQKQIIVTTHNPEVVKFAGLENLLLLSRDRDGYSKVSKPLEQQEVRSFLEDELGIEDLYTQDLLTF